MHKLQFLVLIIYNARIVSRRAESEAQAVARGKDGEARVPQEKARKNNMS